MTLLKTPTVELDEDFTYVGEITKSKVLANGERQIIGVASGIEWDRDEERMSKRAIAKMVTEGQALARKDNLPLTDTHTPDWSNKFGKVRALERDPETQQLVIDTRLPPEGHDPLADKAWHQMHVMGVKLGFSVGGKLRKAFHEINQETGKRCRVLDDVAINHVMLTERPSYDRSFAIAVAKSFAGEPPAKDAYTELVDLDADQADAEAIVAKAAKAPPPKDDEPQEDAPTAGADVPPASPPDADGQPPPEGEQAPSEVSDADMAADLPMARHLSCPNCGHEFAAELPDDLQSDDTEADTDADTGDQPTTKKSQTEPNPMSDTDLLAEIRKLVASSDVAKTVTQDPPTPTAAGDDVMKSVQSIAQGIVATHEAVKALEQETKETFEGIGTVLKSLTDAIGSRPQGRRSVARVIEPPTGHQVAKAAGDGDEPEDLDERLEKAKTAQSAFGEINKSMFPHRYPEAA